MPALPAAVLGVSYYLRIMRYVKDKDIMHILRIYDNDSENAYEVDISTELVEEIEAEMKVLSKCLELESIYDLLVEEYWEYKNKVDYWLLRSLSRPRGYIENYEIRTSLNRMAYNFLNISKLYLDKHYHNKDGKCHAFDITKNEDSKNEVKKQREQIYESNLYYVIGCELRNNAQHSTLPVDLIVYSSGFDRALDKKNIELIVELSYPKLLKLGISKEKISEDETLDLTDVLAGYLLAITEMHFLNRSLTKGTISKSKSKINSIINEKALEFGCVNFTSDIELDGDGFINTQLDWYEVADYLHIKHSEIIDYSNYSFGRK